MSYASKIIFPVFFAVFAVGAVFADEYTVPPIKPKLAKRAEYVSKTSAKGGNYKFDEKARIIDPNIKPKKNEDKYKKSYKTVSLSTMKPPKTKKTGLSEEFAKTEEEFVSVKKISPADVAVAYEELKQTPKIQLKKEEEPPAEQTEEPAPKPRKPAPPKEEFVF